MTTYNLLRTPTGKWVFVGFGLPVQLVFMRKDGHDPMIPLCAEDLHRAGRACVPSLEGFRARAFDKPTQAAAFCMYVGVSGEIITHD
jgi:hypothetical protein